MSQAGTQLVLLLVLLAAFALLVVRPQRARLRAAQQVRASLTPGDRVMTTSGLHADLVQLDGDTVELQIAPGVQVTWATAAIAAVVAPEQAARGGQVAADPVTPPA